MSAPVHEALCALRRWMAPARGGFGRSVLGALGWSGARLALQFVWMVLLARALGVAGYGLWAGLAGLALALSGFAGLGFGLALYRDVANDHSLLRVRWRTARTVYWIAAAPLALIFGALVYVLFDAPSLTVVIALGLSELLLAPLVAQYAFAFASLGKVVAAAAAAALLALARCAAAAVFVFLWLDGPTIESYAWLHLTATGLAVVALAVWCRAQCGIDSTPAWPRPAEWVDGIKMTRVSASGLAAGSLDKTAALSIGSDALAGQYAAAQRFASVLSLPIEAFMTAAMPRLFRHGGGRAFDPTTAAVMVGAVLAYGALAGVAFWLLAPLALVWLGGAFAEASRAVPLLSLWIPLYCLRLFGATWLLGLGATGWRAAVELSALLVAVIAMHALIPSSGLIGAVGALLLAETALMAAFAAKIARSKPAPKP
jgi:O-antigen/teichoic acid export membrane protein